MSQEPETDPVETPDAEDVELLVEDPDDYHESERLREIHKARREVHKVLNDIDGYTDSETHNRQKIDLAQAVSAYAIELEPLMGRTDYDDTLPEKFPFNSITQFMNSLGYYTEDGERHLAGYNLSMFVFRELNGFLAEVKPLITEDDSDEWEV